MKNLNLLFLGFYFFLISSCATATFTQTGETFPKHNEPVQILADYPVDGEYDPIGLLSSQYGMFRNDASLVKALQKKAAKKGANAIVLISYRLTQQSSLPAGPYGFYGDIGTSRDMSAIAIRIRNDNKLE